MSSPYLLAGSVYPRRQADQFVKRLVEEGSAFRGVLLGKRGMGKTDLLRQIHVQLFQKPEGPIPFLYRFQPGRDEAALTRHFFASFCQQVRGFLMRQEDLLGEPVANLERELERPGLPLALTELARNFLALPAGDHREFAAAVPAQFANRERRPVCLLWDDVETLGRNAPFFPALHSPDLVWLLSGRFPFLVRLAGEQAWPLVSLEPFASEEALLLAEKRCREASLAFSKEVWEEWFEIAGHSPWLIAGLAHAAAAGNGSLESLEELGRVYIQELASGTLGNWIAARWQRAVPDRRDQARVVEILLNWVNSGHSGIDPSLVAAETWDGLIAEEWAEDKAVGPQVQLEVVQQDWLWLSLASAMPGSSAGRAQSRALQSFLYQAEQNRRRRQAALWTAIRERLAALPQTGWPETLEWQGSQIHTPRVCSVAVERSGSAELFWCYGFRRRWVGPAEVACVLLIALCEEVPAAREVESWQRELQKEDRLLPAPQRRVPPALEEPGLWQELWLLVPPGTPLVSERSERRFTWDAFSRWLGSGRPSEKHTSPWQQL